MTRYATCEETHDCPRCETQFATREAVIQELDWHGPEYSKDKDNQSARLSCPRCEWGVSWTTINEMKKLA